MSIIQKIEQGQILDNDQLREIFKCSPQGGMRRSRTTNTLVIVSNHIKSIYDDRWINDVFHYTGMGQKEDQSIIFSQNKTLAESNLNGIEVHLFEVEKEKEYIYQGQVTLVSEPYSEIQPDANGNDRKVIVFPLKLIETKPKVISLEDFEKSQKVREKKAKKLSLEELKEKAIRTRKKVGERKVQSIQFERDPYVAQYTKKIYHIASKLPGWLKAVLPTKATELHEEAWNAFASPPLPSDPSSPQKKPPQGSPSVPPPDRSRPSPPAPPAARRCCRHAASRNRDRERRNANSRSGSPDRRTRYGSRVASQDKRSSASVNPDPHNQRYMVSCSSASPLRVVRDSKS